MEYTHFGNNVQFLRESKGLKQSQMLDTIGYPRTTWNNYEKNKSTPNLDDLIKIARFFGVTETELLHVDLSKVPKNLNESPSVSIIDTRRRDKHVLIQGIPYYNISATAGVVSLFSQSSKYIPSSHIVIPNMPKCDGAIPVSGDSMYPLIKHGDTVLYKTLNDKESILWGGMYVVMIVHNGDEIFFVKYVQKSDKPGYARFVSYNDHHQPVEFPMDSITAIAEVKATIRINNAL